MKNYEEMTHDVFQRIDEHEAAKTRRNRLIRRTLLPVGNVCAVAVLGIFLWKSAAPPPSDKGSSDNALIFEPTGSSSAVSEESSISSETGTSASVEPTEITVQPPSMAASAEVTQQASESTAPPIQADKDNERLIGMMGVAEIIESLEINGHNYIICTNEDAANYTEGEYLGKFTSTLKSDKEVYAAAGNGNILIVKSEDGTSNVYWAPLKTS